MTNVSLVFAYRECLLLLSFALLLPGCVNHRPDVAIQECAHNTGGVWLHVTFGAVKEQLSEEESDLLRSYLKSVRVELVWPRGAQHVSWWPKYTLWIVWDGKHRQYDFREDGSLIGAKLAPERMELIKRLIVTVASRMDQGSPEE
jgi:hypothetical protein